MVEIEREDKSLRLSMTEKSKLLRRCFMLLRDMWMWKRGLD